MRLRMRLNIMPTNAAINAPGRMLSHAFLPLLPLTRQPCILREATAIVETITVLLNPATWEVRTPRLEAALY
eukprot:8392123-Lingulodinium_polyedra.AAC.1